LAQFIHQQLAALQLIARADPQEEAAGRIRPSAVANDHADAPAPQSHLRHMGNFPTPAIHPARAGEQRPHGRVATI
jgi:hypothetical protein